MSARGNGTGRRVTFLVWRDTGHPDGGGSELFVERVAAHLASQGWDVTLCCARYPGAPSGELRDGVRFRRRGGRLTVYVHGLAYLLTRRGRRCDVVVDVQNGIPFFSPAVRRRGVVVLVHHVHREQWQIIYPGAFGRFGWWVESRIGPRLYRGRPYVTVSDASRRDLVQLGVRPESISVVHNGIDVPHPEQRRPHPQVPTICVLGRLVAHKQVEHAFDAAARVRGTVRDLRVEVVGDGWWRDRLEAHADELGLRDIVTFHGHVSDDERDAVLDRAWVLLAPSVKEGWGIAIMEAAAHGVPAIAYASAGGVCESIVDGTTGWLVDDVNGLVKRTEELLTDRLLRDWMGANARERAAEFNWRATGTRFDELLGNAMRR
jgi:glycosyltransferase involved in cell wall biosynthesis